MGQDARKDALQFRHAELEDRLDNEITHPSRDTAAIAEIKRQKLRIKDEIARMGTS
ncbi:MAG: DUF465 domain-containing protein [Rhodospirillum sp.]|nr:DUF465 domain-containing protein [Rhodospirillum sp.]MCF8491139.1 DUF465 domain-containing protein [Rhodospirillum sp.]MCF8503033.1 DUF465 domain-containing protein [Rhodospirillum sp.]